MCDHILETITIILVCYSLLYCTVMYYYTILTYAKLYCTVYYALLDSSVLYYTILYYMTRNI